jgi:hypothetical protein
MTLLYSHRERGEREWRPSGHGTSNLGCRVAARPDGNWRPHQPACTVLTEFRATIQEQQTTVPWLGAAFLGFSYRAWAGTWHVRWHGIYGGCNPRCSHASCTSVRLLNTASLVTSVRLLRLLLSWMPQFKAILRTARSMALASFRCRNGRWPSLHSITSSTIALLFFMVIIVQILIN